LRAITKDFFQAAGKMLELIERLNMSVIMGPMTGKAAIRKHCGSESIPTD